MTSSSFLPPARERSRHGLRHLDWTKTPDADDAWPDKLRVRIEGDVRWSNGASFMDYLQLIHPRGYLSANPTAGKTFRSPLKFGPAISGELTVRQRLGGEAEERVSGLAKIDLVLNLNPTRTRSLAVRRHQRGRDLTLRQFFDPVASVAEAFGEAEFAFPDEIAFDDATNVLLTVDELGGSTPTARRASRDDFLLLYESKFRAFVADLLTPRDVPPFPGDEPADQIAGNFELHVGWQDLRIENAELYIERRTSDPVRVVQRLSDRSRDFARHVRLRQFSPPKLHFEFDQNSTIPQLKVPLTGSQNIMLSIYAKTNRRLRFEVQYRKAFSLLVKGASRGEDRLRSMVLLLASNAADRLPWSELGRAIHRQPDVDFYEALDLIGHVVEAAGTGPLFRDILNALLLTGGIYDNPAWPDLPKALRHLERHKVVEWVPLQKKERRAGRRYGLTPHYAEVRERMRHGFLPDAPDELEVFADEVRARREQSTTKRTTKPKSL